jgi:hypothetical protein
MRDLAFRRFQERKKKRWVHKHFKNHWLGGITPADVGIRAHSPAICSCLVCGNPRKHWKQRTIQELRIIDAQAVSLEDIAFNKEIFNDH